MRHLKSGRKLGRTASHKKATLANLAAALFEHKSIVTTKPKAKEARSVVERVVTFAKKGDVAARRQVLKVIRNKELVKEIFENIAPTYQDRNGGYTRITKLGSRRGDNAPMAVLELVGFEGSQAKKIESARKKREAVKEEKAKEAEEAAKEEQAEVVDEK